MRIFRITAGLLVPIEFLINVQKKIWRSISNNRKLSYLNNVTGWPSCGEGLAIENAGYMEIGSQFSSGNFIQLSTYKDGALKIGNRCFIGDCSKLVSDNAEITIGNDVLIAEQVSIRASNHGIALGQLINRQQNIAKNIKIGSDVWIGKGSTILAGADIKDGVVIGANSVVLESSKTEENCIYAGNPIKKIRKR